MKLTKIDIISGFLGAGKTTLIKKLISEAYSGEKIVLIENEFGEIGIDGGFLQDSGVQINEMNSGCICCSLVGDFGRALKSVLEEMHPDRIIIEPSGVGKLSDVIRAVEGAATEDVLLNSFTTVADVGKCKMYMKNFGEFYNDQVSNAGCIVLSHTGKASDKKIADSVGLLREHNKTAVIVTTDWEKLTGADLLEAMERKDTLDAELAHLAHETKHHGHHHEHDEDCTCGCHDHEHGHHHEHDEDCTCGCHDHHHHADEVFTSWGRETTRKYEKSEIETFCAAFDEDSDEYGLILRAKGIVEGTNGEWIHFDYVPGEADVREGAAGVIGRLCVIGSHLNEEKIASLFGTEEV